ncbi:MAG TPA: YjhG/YagF family D-xylonate dehydratase, partial [Terracidiphilus sp.]
MIQRSRAIAAIALESVLESSGRSFRDVRTHAAGPGGSLPLSPEMLLSEPSGNLFGLTQGAGMGWEPTRLLDPQFLILSTHGGLRAENGQPIALGFHTGHWEVGLLVAEAARELKAQRALPFAGACTDPCDGRTQGTTGMMDSLPFRNDAAMVLRRLIRSLPTRKGVIGIATCDKGLPAMMMALASCGTTPAVLVPGGVTLLPDDGEDAGKVQTIGVRFAQKQISLDYAADVGCRACASPGGGCQFLGTAATSQVIGEALGLALPHSALAPSGQPVWLDMATRSARAALRLFQLRIGVAEILTEASLRNAMVLHAAFGGSTNLLLHLPAVAHAARLPRPTAQDWAEVNRSIPRLVDVLPNGPRSFATVQVFLAGGVPEVMLHLRDRGLLDTSVKTASGTSLDECLNWWCDSARRQELRQRLRELDGIDPDDVIMSADQARARGLTSTLCFPMGSLAPEGSVIKSTAIDPSLIGDDNVYRHIGPAKVYVTEEAAIAAIKSGEIAKGDVIVLICGGPAGAGMQEIYQITAALKQLPHCKHVAVVTDARFSGVSTGACIGHVSPEALAGGPVGKIRDGDQIEIVIDRNGLKGTVNLVGDKGDHF